MKTNKFLFALTNHSKLGDTGQPTGWWLSEAAHPWKVLHDAGYEIDFVSPLGGDTPITGEDSIDAIDKEFMANADAARKIKNTLKPSDVNVDDYDGIHYVGGHGAVWDFPDCKPLSDVASEMWKKGKIVSAICHGPAALINIKVDGDYLIKNKKLTCFNDMEERAVDKCEVVPYLLQCALMMKGCDYQIAEIWADHVVADGRLITGQNPQSGLSLGKKILEVIKSERSL